MLRRAPLLASTALLGLSGCVLQATEVLVIVDTNVPGERALDLTASVALDGSATQVHYTWVRRPGTPGSVQLPSSFAVVPPSAAQQESLVILALHLHVDPGTHGEPPIEFKRTARFRFIRHQTTVVRMFLPLECGAASHGCTTVADPLCTVAQRCEDTRQTCNDEANCASPDLAPVPLAQDDASLTSVASGYYADRRSEYS